MAWVANCLLRRPGSSCPHCKVKHLGARLAVAGQGEGQMLADRQYTWLETGVTDQQHWPHIATCSAWIGGIRVNLGAGAGVFLQPERARRCPQGRRPCRKPCSSARHPARPSATAQTRPPELEPQPANPTQLEVEVQQRGPPQRSPVPGPGTPATQRTPDAAWPLL